MKFSKKDVVRAGKNLIDDDLLNDQEKFNSTMDILTYWRDSHLVPLEKSNQLLNRYIHNIDKNAFIAKRIKRFDSIKRKLKRFDKMELKNMQDIGGIRVVVSSQKQVDSILKILTNEMCFYNKNNELIKIDNYIKNPKFDGYRSVHIVGIFKNSEGEDRKIEFQLRTKLQHSWATTLEIIDIFTQQNLKSDSGFQNYKNFFKYVSDLFQLIESFKSFQKNNIEELRKDLLNHLEKNDVLFQEAYGIMSFLRQGTSNTTIKDQLQLYCLSLKELNQKLSKSDKNSFILIRLNIAARKLEHENFSKKESKEALERYSLYEQTLSQNPNIIVALLSTDAIGGLQEAYPNYFADSEMFLKYINIIEATVQLIMIKKHLNHISSQSQSVKDQPEIV
ncbi:MULTISPECIES: RelA/SpoT domain-containing protein [Acinetobacter]|uniref:RelA/SpoT domain-containing protein n=1 Tax=Acinetobacter TaxID=469 RepID=UPI00244C8D8A|nr:RelA/SpoT domain-containing protein [Acinetobacter johnsonii]MDH1519784.1 RelA/SpoT domain-containing protein [Acinetobacter johnsonii]